MAPPLMKKNLQQLHLLISLISLLSIMTATVTTSTPAIGVTYSPYSSDKRQVALPPPEKVASTLEHLKIPAVRLHPDADPSFVRAFSYSTTTALLLTIPNHLIPSLAAANRSTAAATSWLKAHVVPFYPRTRISAISVGSDALDSDPDLSTSLLPALRNVHLALRELGIRQIAVSTAFSFLNILTTAFPPSAAEFQEPFDDLVFKPLLQFLRETNSPFLINLYPYHLYRLSPEIPIGFALFQEHPFAFRDDSTTGVRYRNLYDMMLDAVICAMAVAGHENIPVVVAETGWPSAGSDSEKIEANPFYAQMYLKGLITHLRSGIGTPLRKEGAVQVYVYELFDDNPKKVIINNGTTKGAGAGAGADSSRKWGIMYPNMTYKYNIDFGGAATSTCIPNNNAATFLLLIISTVSLLKC